MDFLAAGFSVAKLRSLCTRCPSRDELQLARLRRPQRRFRILYDWPLAGLSKLKHTVNTKSLDLGFLHSEDEEPCAATTLGSEISEQSDMTFIYNHSSRCHTRCQVLLCRHEIQGRKGCLGPGRTLLTYSQY